jgi:predicted RNA binding protein YcfA (HicA-like mRNA interferase family)
MPFRGRTSSIVAPETQICAKSTANKRETMKIRDLPKLIERDGWLLRNQEGSHRQFVHPVKPGKVTVAGHPSAEVDPKTKASILKQAGIK